MSATTIRWYGALQVGKSSAIQYPEWEATVKSFSLSPAFSSPDSQHPFQKKGRKPSSKHFRTA